MLLQWHYRYFKIFGSMGPDLVKTLFYRPLYHHCSMYRNYSLRTKSSSFNYCLELVEKKDLENFYCALLLPKELRHPGLVLRAFNAEIASVQDHVTENIIGEMRFQFWEDTVNKIYDGVVPEHPLCQQLAKAVQTGKISKVYLQRLIMSRRKYSKMQFKSMQDAEEYSDWSNSSLYFALLELAEIKSVEADHAASHLGKAQGLSIILRSTPHNAQKNIVTLPQDLQIKHRVSQEDILRNKVNTNMKNLIFEMASVIHQHLEKVEQIQKQVNRKTRCLFLPVVPIRSYLKKLRSLDFNVFDPKLQKKNELLTLKLFCKKMFL